MTREWVVDRRSLTCFRFFFNHDHPPHHSSQPPTPSLVTMAPTPTPPMTVDASALPECVRSFNKDFHLEPERLQRILEAFKGEFVEGELPICIAG